MTRSGMNHCDFIIDIISGIFGPFLMQGGIQRE